MNSINIHNVVAVSVFRENGHVKISAIDNEDAVIEVSLYGHDDIITPLLRESTNRVPCIPSDFGIVK